MIKKVKNWLRSKTPLLHATASFAQEGEDMILRQLFEGKAPTIPTSIFMKTVGC